MTAINDLVEAAGSMGASGRLGALNEAVAGISVPFSIIYKSLPPIAVRMSSASAIGIAQMAGTDGTAEQALPVDIYSLIEEIRRSISELKSRTANVPDIYTYYIPAAAQAPIQGLSGMPEPGLQPVDRPPLTHGQLEAMTAKGYEGREPAGDSPAKLTHALDNDIIQSNLALGRLREDYAGLTWDLMEIERLIDGAMRSSAADIPAIVSAKAGSIVPSPEASIEYIERPAPEIIVTEKTTIVKDEAAKESARDMELTRRDAVVTEPSKLASVLAQGISLPGIIRKSTVEMMVMQTVLAAEAPAPGMIAPVQAASVPVSEHGQFVVAPAVTAGSSSAPVPDAVPDKITTKLTVLSTPVAQAVDIARIFNGLIGSYLAVRGTTERRGAMKDGITQLLLSLPEQQAVEGPVSGLFDVMAGLQAAGAKAIETPPPVKTLEPSALTVPLTGDESMRSTILGDLREIQGTMSSLQDAFGSLRRAGTTMEASRSTEVPTITDFADSMPTIAPAAALPASEGMSGELSGIYISIARLQAAMDYLRANVPTLADFVVLQRVVASAPVEQAFSLQQDVPPAGVSIEGVQPKSAPIRFPDFSWVTREFGQMQGMIARLQVPMYAEGGLVEQPTLAFVGEAEPEWIVPQSVLEDFQSNIVDFQSDIIGSYSLLWSEIQELGTSMQGTVDGVNTALEGLQAAGEEESDTDAFRVKFVELMDSYVDEYLGPLGFSMENLKNLGTTTGLSSMSMGTAAALFPRVKNLFTEDEEEEKGDSGGGKEEAKEEDDEEDFWKMIDDLDKAASISDKRKGKFESE